MKMNKHSVSPEELIHSEVSCSCWPVNVWIFLTKQMMFLNPKVFRFKKTQSLFPLRIVLKHHYNIRGDFYERKNINNWLFLWETARQRCKESFQWSRWVHSVTAVRIYTLKRFAGVVSCQLLYVRIQMFGTFWPQSSEFVCYWMVFSLTKSVVIIFIEHGQDLLAHLKRTNHALNRWKY